MAITLVTKMWSKDTSDVNSRGGKSWKISAQESYMATGDDPANDTEQDVLNHPDVPQQCDYWQGTVASVANRSVETVGPTTYIVTVNYAGQSAPGNLAASAINEPAIVTWGDTSSTEAIDQDVFGNPIVNVNGESLDGVSMEISDLTLNATRKFATFNPGTTLAYRHSVNSDAFYGFAPGLVRLTGFSADEVFDSACGGYWQVSAQFTIRYNWRSPAAYAWAARVRNEGYYERRGASIVIAGGGSGATAVPVIDPSDGSIVRVDVTNRGSDYTDGATTATISDPAGLGNGAAFTVNVNNTTGLVQTIDVDTAGSDYTSFMAPIRDGEGAPVNRPFLLDASGRQLEGENALWLYYQKYAALPYSALGIL